jgi:hypothetical protein
MQITMLTCFLGESSLISILRHFEKKLLRGWFRRGRGISWLPAREPYSYPGLCLSAATQPYSSKE